MPEASWSPPVSFEREVNLSWIKGQLEEGAGGFRHWQVVIASKTKKSLQGIKGINTLLI